MSSRLRSYRIGWLLAIAAPFDDPEWTYRSYAAATDYQILMAYDEHFEEGQPGAIASQSWFVDKLTRRMKELDPAKTIIALGNYGYDWAEKPPAIDMTFQETVLTSKESTRRSCSIRKRSILISTIRRMTAAFTTSGS